MIIMSIDVSHRLFELKIRFIHNLFTKTHTHIVTLNYIIYFVFRDK